MISGNGFFSHYLLEFLAQQEFSGCTSSESGCSSLGHYVIGGQWASTFLDHLFPVLNCLSDCISERAMDIFSLAFCCHLAKDLREIVSVLFVNALWEASVIGHWFGSLFFLEFVRKLERRSHRCIGRMIPPESCREMRFQTGGRLRGASHAAVWAGIPALVDCERVE
jgi:hypothetical protein